MAKKSKRKTTKNQKRTKKEEQKPFIIRFFTFCLHWGAVFAVWGLIALIGIAVWFGHDLPEKTKDISFERKRSVTLLAGDGETVLARYGEVTGQAIQVENLPDYVAQAVIAIEDRRFHYHFGLDPIGIIRAAMINAKAGRIVQGGSTLTQQLAKNLFLTPQRTMERKIQEALLALWLEFTLTKEEILSAYLNRVYFGAGAYGIDAAANIYFGKSANNLTRYEAAMMAGLLKAPSRFSPRGNLTLARQRADVVLGAMRRSGYIDDSDVDSMSNNGQMATPQRKPFQLSETSSHMRYFTDWVMTGLSAFHAENGQDLIVTTTLNPRFQNTGVARVTEILDSTFKGKEKPQSAFMLLDQDGAIRAMSGGNNYGESEFNRATDAMRQPGSLMKPFVYLAAMERGWGPNDLISDQEITQGRYRPTNYDGEYHDEVLMWEALAQSYNVAAVRLLDEIGVNALTDLMRRLGVTQDLPHELALALGSADLSMLDMARIYAVLQANGQARTPYALLKVETQDGDVLYNRNESIIRSTNQILAEAHRDALTLMLERVITEGTGTRAATGFPVAGKTGTTQRNRDAWFAGYSDRYTAVVWLGHDDNTPMRGVYGGTVPASIWRDLMRTAHGSRGGEALTGTTLEEQDQPDIEGFFQRLFFGRSSSSRSDETSNRNQPQERFDFND